MKTADVSRITGIGSALVDILISESDQFLVNLNKEKGGMTLVDHQEIENILSQTDCPPQVVSGGAACNTIVGVGCLGGDARFIGKRGADPYGNAFEKQLLSSHVEPRVTIGESPTGQVLSVVTPDAQRSMFTFLGASTELAPESVTPDLFKDTAIAMIEGYLLFNRDLMMAALSAAKTAGAMIALDLASFEVVNAAGPALSEIIKAYVDILIANEDEAAAFTGLKDEDKTIEALAGHSDYAVLKIGERGSYIAHDQSIHRIDPVVGQPPKDTTGAGDLWAAGFLYGIAHGMDIDAAGRLGSACGYEVCQVMGAQLPPDAWQRIKALL